MVNYLSAEILKVAYKKAHEESHNEDFIELLKEEWLKKEEERHDHLNDYQGIAIQLKE
ncbi:sporulation histidine kinase inhibitor Sda [Alkalicoccobacillus porphyridii]|uniref:Sporulation histidine kinase inhibitor Sda n=1 Tax=Alkalicoccobacillus porphyridii TaxID=2597270 RepID=A0A553ZZR2_9BACI|nr:sporulation histidine kinase inhibitor Sda [Alkalicoccobacillus porphyridii]TSB46934.1 sporulation histidine kinase inhibitor Sda [Alkalicoccobacillus porphyridii]